MLDDRNGLSADAGSVRNELIRRNGKHLYGKEGTLYEALIEEKVNEALAARESEEEAEEP